MTSGGATRNVGRATTELIDDASGGGGQASGGTTTITTTPTTQSSKALSWGTGDADSILNQLLNAKPPAPRPIPTNVKRSARAQAAYARRIAKMTPAQRKKLVLQKYKIPPVSYLAHYLPADRYKITSGVWKFVSTETDRFYYNASAPAMLRQSPSRVIGFHTWQDAMIAGYRPDPITKPTPGAQFAALARIGRGPQLRNFVEYAYAGQMTPQNFATTYSYIQKVVAAVNKRPYARPLLPQTVETILEASLTGNPDLIPRQIGGQPRLVEVVADPNAQPVGGVATVNQDIKAGGRGALIEGGGQDKREEEFNQFSNRAGSLAASGAERNRDLSRR